MDKDFLLRTYGQCYGEEGGPFNLSLANKYLEYMFAKFFKRILLSSSASAHVILELAQDIGTGISHTCSPKAA